MNGLNNTNDDVIECPLCMEPLEVDDLNFYPCTCGYQICRFCWHRIRTDENKLCPACRKEYPENPADFTPLTQEQMIAFKSQKRQRDQQRKQKITENRKHLANVRVVQKNLVFVVGLPPRLADADILKKHEYFGKYGKIHKVVINPSTTYAGVQGPSASAYVTYVHNCDALRAIQSVNNIMIDGRLIKTSLGTTKYCSHFMKNQQCPKSDCMYLHELGDPEASFTKEEMHQGKHQEYEKRLHDALIATAGANTSNGLGQAATTNGTVTTGAPGTAKQNGSSNMSSSTSSTSSTVATAQNPGSSSIAVACQQQKEVWPSLSVSPVNVKESSAPGTTGTTNVKNLKKDKSRNEKSRNEKSTKSKTKNSNNNSNVSNKENNIPDSRGDNSSHSNLTTTSSSSTSPATEATTTIVTKATSANMHKVDQSSNSSNSKSSRNERSNKEKLATSNHRTNAKELQQQHQPKEKHTESFNGHEEDDTVNRLVDSLVADESSSNAHANSTINLEDSTINGVGHRSLSSSSEDRTSALSDSSVSGKSSPGSFQDTQSNSSNAELYKTVDSIGDAQTSLDSNGLLLNNLENTSSLTDQSLTNMESEDSVNLQILDDKDPVEDLDMNSYEKSTKREANAAIELQNIVGNDNILNTAAALSKLNLFDDNNSFFSSSSSAAAASFQQSMLLKNKVAAELRQNQMNASPHLPDLLNGIDGYQKTSNTNEWEEAFKNVMMRNNKHVEEQLLHQQHLQQQQQQHHQQLLQQQEEYLRMHEIQKRNNLLNNMGLSPMNGPHNDFTSSFHSNAAAAAVAAADLSRLSHASLMQQQLQLQQQQQQQPPPPPNEGLLSNNIFGANMSKFFDFHKSQQQLNQQYLNGHASSAAADPLRIASFLENNRINAQYGGDNNLLQQQQQLQKQRLLGKFDSVSQNQAQISQPSKSHLPNHFSQNSSADDDLGFDPFIETQKGLAELMENEVVQQQNGANINTGAPSKLISHQQQQQAQAVSQQQQQQLLDNMQRARMPPPGFNHMNNFGFGGMPRGQQNTSKILPFMNMTNNIGVGNGGGQMNSQLSLANNWNPHMPTAYQQQAHQQQQQLSLADNQLPHPLSQNQNPGNHKGYSNNDWTAMDPAILSFRQFSSFPQHTQMPPHPQQQQQPQDMFLQHLAQQQQSAQGFNNPGQILPGMPNLPNNVLNVQQQTSQAQVNANVQGMLEFLKNRQFV